MANEQGHAARVGSVIKGKWTVEGLLGVGGMAAVYAAQHRNGQRAALKILHTDFAREKTICERFLREAYVSNKIGHPACVCALVVRRIRKPHTDRCHARVLRCERRDDARVQSARQQQSDGHVGHQMLSHYLSQRPV